VQAGDVKASGSFFHDMTAEERQTWQDVVDTAYENFLDRIAASRPLTKDQLRKDVVLDQPITVRDDKGNPKSLPNGQPETTRYTRRRADGGTFTAEQALQYQLVDKIEDLPATVRPAAAAAGLGRFQVVVYDGPFGVVDYLVGTQAKNQDDFPSFRTRSPTLTPRLWYLTPTVDSAVFMPNP